MKRFILLFFTIILSGYLSYGGTGSRLLLHVEDKQSGEALAGVTIQLSNGQKILTDLDGYAELFLEKSETVKLNALSYNKQEFYVNPFEQSALQVSLEQK